MQFASFLDVSGYWNNVLLVLLTLTWCPLFLLFFLFSREPQISTRRCWLVCILSSHHLLQFFSLIWVTLWFLPIHGLVGLESLSITFHFLFLLVFSLHYFYLFYCYFSIYYIQIPFYVNESWLTHFLVGELFAYSPSTPCLKKKLGIHKGNLYWEEDISYHCQIFYENSNSLTVSVFDSESLTETNMLKLKSE